MDLAQWSLNLHLDRSQWASRDEMTQAQQYQLWRLLSHAYSSVPFYRRQWDALGIRPHLDPSCWSALPMLSRSDIQRHNNELRSRSLRHSKEVTCLHVSGGSTGQPVSVLGTARTQLYWRAITMREHCWNQRKLDGTLAVIRHLPEHRADPPFGLTLRGWGAATRGITRTGPCKLLSIHTTTYEQRQWLKRINPQYLLSYPSVLVAIAREMLANQEHVPGLLQVRTFGENLDDEMREICTQAFRAPVVDNYSAEEVGNIALECPHSRKYHVQDESLLVEMLDAEGNPCPIGQPGRVLVTTLQNFVMPLIRYELGDYAVPGPACDCGRGLGVIDRILGRTRNMFLRPDGQQMWPSLRALPQDCPGLATLIRQFQVVQESQSHVIANLVTAKRLNESEEDAVSRWIQQSLGWPCQVTLHYVPSIARSPRGKYEDFRSIIPREEYSHAHICA